METTQQTVLPESLSRIYRIERELGSGVYGDVYLASHRTNRNHKVAIKKLRPAASRYKGVFGVDQTTLRELASLRALSHSNIVGIDDFAFEMETVNTANNQKKTYPIFYFVFEICDTDLLRLIGERYNTGCHRVGKQTKCSEPEKKNYNLNMRRPTEPYEKITELEIKVLMYQMLQGLAYSHAKRIVHRDLKPSNIMLTEMIHKNKRSWLVKIGDFGLARTFCEESLKGRTEEVVTMIYRGPELLLRKPNYGSEVDIWAAATIMGELALGQPMFRATGQWEVLIKIFSLLGAPTETEIAFMRDWRYFEHTLPKIQSDKRATIKKFFTDHHQQPLFSDCALDLMLRMMEYDPERRITAVAALRHPWFHDISKHIPQELFETYHVGNSSLPFHYLSLGVDFPEDTDKTQLEPSIVVNKFETDARQCSADVDAVDAAQARSSENVLLTPWDHIFGV